MNASGDSDVLPPSLNGPVVYRVDVRRFPILLPLSLLVLVTVASATAAVLHLPVDNDLSRTWRATAIFLVLFYFGYVRRTTLTVSEAGLELRQSFTSRMVAWSDIAAAWTTSNLDATHKGGVAAGLHLKLRSGKSAFVPDIFGIHRRDLAKLVTERTALPSVVERLSQGRD